VSCVLSPDSRLLSPESRQHATEAHTVWGDGAVARVQDGQPRAAEEREELLDPRDHLLRVGQRALSGVVGLNTLVARDVHML
jgi:hypothetical protein